MPSRNEYLNQADKLAQEVINAWGTNTLAGNAAYLSNDFKALFDKAFQYRQAKAHADNRRKFDKLNKVDEVHEQTTREAFIDAYIAFKEKDTG